MSKLTDIQAILGVTPDGAWGPLTQSALDALVHPASVPADPAVHAVKASSFADPADVAAFHKAKARGLSDEEAFAFGDNGIGKWGDDCTGMVPMCALPPEDWEPFGEAARLKPVLVTCNGKKKILLHGDTMPHRRFITNGAGIDFSPASCAFFGLRPPVMVPATWKWATPAEVTQYS